jgi:hypothetical protein
MKGMKLPSLMFPSNERDTSTQILYSRKSDLIAASKLMSGMSNQQGTKAESMLGVSLGHEDLKSIDQEEELKVTDNLLENHPYEIKYILNKKTNRKLKRMVCMYEGCGKHFEKKWNFKDHIRMHKGDTPYQCSHCDKSFTQRGNLVKHERQHKFVSLKARKVHKCLICTKSFTEKYNLKVRNTPYIYAVDSSHKSKL